MVTVGLDSFDIRSVHAVVTISGRFSSVSTVSGSWRNSTILGQVA